MRWLAVSRRLVLPTVVAAVVVGTACSSPVSPSPTAPDTPLPSLEVMLADKTVGRATAPVTMTEYSSLSCTHCAQYHADTWPLIKTTYVDAGQVRLVYRDLPTSEAALGGTMVARCSGGRFFEVLEVLYRDQAQWVFAGGWRSALEQVVAPLNITPNDVAACLEQTALRAGVQTMAQEARTQAGVTSIPTFLINGQTVIGALPYGSFVQILQPLIPPHR